MLENVEEGILSSNRGLLHDHVTVAMLKSRNNSIFYMRIDTSLRGKQDSIVLPFNLAAVTWSCKVSTLLYIK